MNLIIVFGSLFSFLVPFFYNTTILLLSLLITIKFLKPKSYQIYRSQYLNVCHLSVIFFIVASIGIILVNELMDFSVLRSPVVLLAAVTQMFIAGSYIKSQMIAAPISEINYLHYAIKMVVLAFVFQSAIQLFAFFSPTFLDVIRYFQHEADAQLMLDGYGTLRGLALSSELSFSLAAGYGLVIIYFSLYAIKTDVKISKKIIYYLFLVVGSIFSGRTAFIGVVVGYILYFHLAIVEKRRYLHLLLSPFFVIVSTILILENPPEELEPLLKFAFEFYYTFKETGSASTESTNILLNNHLSVLKNVNASTVLFGDGLYTNKDGSYYMGTDSGYMRNIYFGGLLILSFKILSQLIFNFGWMLLGCRFHNARKLLILNIYSFLYLIILHIKGDSLINLKICMLMIFFVNFIARPQHIERKRNVSGTEPLVRLLIKQT